MKIIFIKLQDYIQISLLFDISIKDYVGGLLIILKLIFITNLKLEL
jgi:hypothetical protein